MIHCFKCGEDLPDNVVYCLHCGNDVTETETVVGTRAAGPPVTTRRKWSALVIGTVVGAAILAAVVAAITAFLYAAAEHQRAETERARAEQAQRDRDAEISRKQSLPLPTVPATVAPAPKPTVARTPKPAPVEPTPRERPETPTGPPPPNATARCNDGTFSLSLNPPDICSRTGVREWFVNGIQPGRRPRAICGDGHISYWTGDNFATCLTGGGVRWWYYRH